MSACKPPYKPPRPMADHPANHHTDHPADRHKPPYRLMHTDPPYPPAGLHRLPRPRWPLAMQTRKESEEAKRSHNTCQSLAVDVCIFRHRCGRACHVRDRPVAWISAWRANRMPSMQMGDRQR